MSTPFSISTPNRSAVSQGTPRPRALLPISFIRADLRQTEDEVLALIEEGQLEWVWDFSGPNRRSAEYRILPAAYEAYLRRRENRTQNGRATSRRCHTPTLSLEAAIKLALPHDGAAFRLSELALAFVCSQQHLGNLVRAGLLAQTPARYITRLSAITFLKSRRAN